MGTRPPCRWAVAASGLISIFALVACGSPERREDHDASAPATPRSPIRLVEAIHRKSDDPSMASVPTAMVGGVRRPVLSASRSRVLLRERVTVSRSEPLRVRVPIPEAYRGAPLHVSSTLAAFRHRFPPDPSLVPWRTLAVFAKKPVPVRRQTPRVLGEPGSEEPIEIELEEGMYEGNSLLVVSGHQPPERRLTSPRFVPPPGARLAFGIGIEDFEGFDPVDAVRFELTAIDDDGTSRSLYERRLDPDAESAPRGWIDVEIALDDLAERPTRLVFHAAAETSEPGISGSFPVWSDPTVWTPSTGEPPEAPKNVLLISLDTLRADHLGCYGYDRPTSPIIDAKIARGGALFERAYTSYPSTEVAHLTMLTSLDPCVQGMTGDFPTLRSDAHTLAELLRAAGYETAAFTENGWVTAESGFARGFGTFVEDRRVGLAGSAEETFDRAVEWIETRGGDPTRPWFVFVHTYQVHHPYTPPDGYLERVAPHHGTDRPSRDAALYDSEIRYTDDLLGDLFDRLGRSAAFDGTVVVLTSDHGEQFGEHGLFVHSNSLYEPLLHVPLIIRAPGLVPEGVRVGSPVGLVDLVPTLLDLLDLPPARWAQGRSLVPLLRGDPSPERTLYAQWQRDRFSARFEGLKWILYPDIDRRQVFDVRSDPGEAKNLFDEMPDGREAEIVRAFEEHCRAPAPPESAGEEREPSPSVVEKLKALGYLD